MEKIKRLEEPLWYLHGAGRTLKAGQWFGRVTSGTRLWSASAAIIWMFGERGIIRKAETVSG
jgi:hypothetical protein